MPEDGPSATRTPEPNPPPGHGDEWAVRTSRGVARGEKEALAEFYGVWFNRCYALTRQTTGRDESFCLDVVQDAMIKAAASLKPVFSEAALNAWMSRVVRSCALDRLRSENARVRRERSAGAAGVPAAGVNDDLAARIEWLERELAAAKQIDRDLLRHRVLGGATLEQAAAASGISGPSAHGRLRRLLDSLRRAGKERFGDA